MYFRYFVIISPWKRAGHSFEQTWIFFTPKNFVLSLVEIDPVVLEKKIIKFRQCIFTNSLLSLLEKGGALHLNKLESPLLKDALYQVWLKLAQWIWRRRFFSFVNVFSLFRNHLPLEKGVALHLNKSESPSPKDD